MNVLSSIMGNKTLVNAALSSVRGSMEKDGISVIVIERSEDMESDIPGLKVASYQSAVGVLTGNDLEEYVKYREVLAKIAASSGNFLVLTGQEAIDYYFKSGRNIISEAVADMDCCKVPALDLMAGQEGAATGVDESAVDRNVSGIPGEYPSSGEKEVGNGF